MPEGSPITRSDQAGAAPDSRAAEFLRAPGNAPGRRIRHGSQSPVLDLGCGKQLCRLASPVDCDGPGDARRASRRAPCPPHLIRGAAGMARRPITPARRGLLLIYGLYGAPAGLLGRYHAARVVSRAPKANVAEGIRVHIVINHAAPRLR